jgi:hypothetical protein
MCRDSTPDWRTRSRLHQLPVTVFRSSGRNQTFGACVTQMRSSSGMAAMAICGLDAGQLQDRIHCTPRGQVIR